MFMPQNRRVVPAAAILTIGGLMLVSAIVSGFYLNLDHQRVGFEFVYPPFVKAPQLLGHPQAWCLALVVDMLMGGCEVISVALRSLANYWEAQLDDLAAARVKSDTPQYKRLARKLASARLAGKWSTYVFMGSGMISILMVGTAFATSISASYSESGFAPFILPVAIGCMTPLLIAASSYIFLTALQFFIDLYDEQADVEAQPQNSEVTEETTGRAFEEGKQKMEPATEPAQRGPRPQGNNPKGDGRRHGGNTPPRREPQVAAR